MSGLLGNKAVIATDIGVHKATLFRIMSSVHSPERQRLGQDLGCHNMHDVVVYSRKGCHLCEVVKETLIKAQSAAGFQWREVDIDADPELRGKYTDEVPVVFIDGRKSFKYHMGMDDFLRVLARRA